MKNVLMILLFAIMAQFTFAQGGTTVTNNWNDIDGQPCITEFTFGYHDPSALVGRDVNVPWNSSSFSINTAWGPDYYITIPGHGTQQLTASGAFFNTTFTICCDGTEFEIIFSFDPNAPDMNITSRETGDC